MPEKTPHIKAVFFHPCAVYARTLAAIMKVSIFMTTNLKQAEVLWLEEIIKKSYGEETKVWEKLASRSKIIILALSCMLEYIFLASPLTTSFHGIINT